MSRGFLAARSSGGGRDCPVAGSRRHSEPDLAGVCQAIGQCADGLDAVGAVRKGGAGHANGPGRC